MNEKEQKGFLRQCRHFNGIQNACCKAGINYRDLPKKAEGGILLRLPCLGEPGAAACSKREPNTQADLDAELAMDKLVGERMAKALGIIKTIKARHGKTAASGVEPCPECGGKLHYRVAAGNGHLRLNCETPDCIVMME